MRGAARAAAAIFFALVLVGCSDGYDFKFPDKSQVDVDTPKLRQEKKQAGVEPCRPGAGANDLPAITLPCFGGGPDVEISGLEGPLIVNVWAGWCTPCRKEMPTLEAFFQEYGDQVGVVGINVRDPQTESAMELVKETGATYPLLADTGDELAEHDPFKLSMGIPMFVFVRADGSIYPVSQVVESMDELLDLVETNLGLQL